MAVAKFAAGHTVAATAREVMANETLVGKPAHEPRREEATGDGTEIILLTKRLDGGRSIWPKPSAEGITLTRVPFDALFRGVDWREIAAAAAPRKPSFI